MTDIQSSIKPLEKPNELSNSQFYLSPLEVILINKKMPFGIKLENEDNVLKSIEISKKVVKKSKITSDKNKYRRNDNSELMSNDNSVDQTKMIRDRRPVPRDDLGYAVRDNMKNKTTPAKTAINKKCEKGLNIIKKYPLSEHFYHSNSIDIPSLSAIEKKIKNYKYEVFNDFANDLRKLWSFYFSNYSTNPDIYQKTLMISNYTEGIINELQSNSNNTKQEPSNDFKEITKKINTIQRDIKDMKGNQMPNAQDKRLPNEKTTTTVSTGDIPMSSSEKTQLSFNIKKLPPDQLGGIIQIMKDTANLNDNKSHIEFDINSLPVRKLRELEKYVNTCLEATSSTKNYQKLKTDLVQKGGSITSNHTMNNQSQGQGNRILAGNNQPMQVQQNTLPRVGNAMPNNVNQGEKKGITEQPMKKPTNTDKAILSESDSSSSSDSNSSLSSFN